MKSKREAVLDVLAAAGRRMNCKEVFGACDALDDIEDASKTLWGLYRDKKAVRERDGTGKYAYWVPAGQGAQAQPSPGIPVFVSQRGHGVRLSPRAPSAPAETPVAAIVEMAESAEKPAAHAAADDMLAHAAAFDTAGKLSGRAIDAAQQEIMAALADADRVAQKAPRCALYSDGTLLIERAEGGLVELNREEVMLLRAYLLQIGEDLLCA